MLVQNTLKPMFGVSCTSPGTTTEHGSLGLVTAEKPTTAYRNTVHHENITKVGKGK